MHKSEILKALSDVAADGNSSNQKLAQGVYSAIVAGILIPKAKRGLLTAEEEVTKETVTRKIVEYHAPTVTERFRAALDAEFDLYSKTPDKLAATKQLASNFEVLVNQELGNTAQYDSVAVNSAALSKIGEIEKS